MSPCIENPVHGTSASGQDILYVYETCSMLILAHNRRTAATFAHTSSAIFAGVLPCFACLDSQKLDMFAFEVSSTWQQAVRLWLSRWSSRCASLSVFSSRSSTSKTHLHYGTGLARPVSLVVPSCICSAAQLCHCPRMKMKRRSSDDACYLVNISLGFFLPI